MHNYRKIKAGKPKKTKQYNNIYSDGFYRVNKKLLHQLKNIKIKDIEKEIQLFFSGEYGKII